MATPKTDLLQGMNLDLFIVNHLERLRRMGNIKANLQKRSRTDYDTAYVKRQLEILEREWDEAQTRHARLLASVSLEERKNEEYFASDFMDDFERIYHETNGYIYGQLRILEKKEQQEEREASNNASHSSADNQSSVRLPRLDLPHFSGKHPEWPSFSDLFTSAVINNRTLSDAQRLQYLKAALEGDALRTVSPLELTNENFSIAWETLEQRYNHPRLIQSSWFEKVLHLKPIKHDNVGSITQVTVGLQQALTALPKLGVSVTDWGPLMVYHVSNQFDKELMLEWEQTFDDARRFPEFEKMMSFLQNKVSAISARPASSKYENRKVKSHAAAVDTRQGDSSLTCSLCPMQHRLSDCKEFKQRDAQGRYFWVKANYLCIRCLGAGHDPTSCKNTNVCSTCGDSHHTLLHFERKMRPGPSRKFTPRRDTRGRKEGPRKANNPPEAGRDSQTASASKPVTSHCGTTADNNGSISVLLATAYVRIYGPNGKSRLARALLDQGSETSFISNNLANELCLKRRRTPATVTGLGGGRTATVKYSGEVGIGNRKGQTPSLRANALIVNKITSYTPPRINANIQELFGDIELADPNPYADARIDVLLGADVYARVLKGGLRRINDDSPIAQETDFGWIISGSIQGASPPTTISSLHCNVLESLDAAIRKFWEIEAVPIIAHKTLDEAECEEHYVRTVSRNEEGRFVVRLPFKRPHAEEALGDSLRIALSALTRLRKKLDANAALLESYGDFLKEYESLNHMTRLKSVDSTRSYIPHRAVVREESVTTKLRVVFNASSASAGGSSLNGLLHVGPKLQRDITAILTNWRLYQYVMVADIEKMFRQILVAPEDRKYQCIVWRSPEDERLSAFELNTVTYGTACAPYLSMRTLLELAKRDGEKYPLAVPVIENDVYVDDVFLSATDKTRLEELRVQVCALLKGGGFHLRKWAGNSEDLLRNIPQSEHSHAVDLTLFSDSELKVLGLRWIPSEDYFFFNLQRFIPTATPITKRTLFSEIAKLYDPLGWLSPVVIRAKILMQAQWLQKLHWDQPVSAETHRTWNSFCEDWVKLNKLKIPRWVKIGKDVKSIELHGFCDASLAAYSATAYLRVITADASVHTSLLIAKTRVAPIKTLTVPVLELNGALLLAELLHHIQSSLAVAVKRTICWTDSTIALAWLQKHPSTWKLVIANRVSKIQTTLPNAEWRHVPTRYNPADLNSRGVEAEELLNSKLWFSGPSWLTKSEDEWPAKPTSLETEDGKRVTHAHVVTPEREWEFLLRFSTWKRLLHVTAYCIRFYRILKGERKRGESVLLDSSELREASTKIVQHLQRTEFKEERRCLQQQRPIPSKSRLRALHPFLDEDEVLRVGGRLENSMFAWDTKHPIILPKHYVSTLIIRQSHLQTLHGGLQQTIFHVRQRFWILGCRDSTRTVINKCVRCVRWRARPSVQIMQHLVPERSRPARAFANCGVDYAGPYRVRDSAGRGKTAHKAYIAVFVCYTTRAIHIELVHDYTTNAFLAAFERFISRRGIPVCMLSDNGTNFVGAHRELMREFTRCYNSDEMRNKCSELGIKWKFNPPSAPHFGGLQEAGVKSVKHHLKRVMGEFTPTGEEMQTLLCKIEASLNSRPIAPMSDSADDYSALTPGHFLIGEPLNALPHVSVEDVNLSRLSRWKVIQKFHEQLWKHWSRDYLLHLQQRYKWQTTQAQLQPGDLVLVQNPLLPPNQWEMGRVKKVFTGQDENVRVVEVQTAKGTYTRAITRLCKIPNDDTSQTPTITADQRIISSGI